MANDEQQRPLAAIVGERLKAFRDARGLRQADVAAAASQWGLSWARSSIAALEAGTRNLSLEEVLILPFVMDDLGGWDQPLIEPESWIAMTPTRGIQAKHLASVTALLTTPQVLLTATTPLRDMAFGIRKAEQEAADREGDLYTWQMHAEDEAWRLFCARVYPSLPYKEIAHGANLGSDLELVTKVAKRIENPDGGPASWGLINVLSRALWNAPLQEERDRRAGERGVRGDRALQSVKGHVTRELINELNAEAAKIWPVLNEIFGELSPIWNDAERLGEWADHARAAASRLYRRHQRAVEVQEFEASHPEENAALEEIGEFLKAARLAAGMTTEEVAEAMGRTVQVIDAIERADWLKARPEARVYKHISTFAEAVGADADSLTDAMMRRLEDARRIDRGDS